MHCLEMVYSKNNLNPRKNICFEAIQSTDELNKVFQVWTEICSDFIAAKKFKPCKNSTDWEVQNM